MNLHKTYVNSAKKHIGDRFGYLVCIGRNLDPSDRFFGKYIFKCEACGRILMLSIDALKEEQTKNPNKVFSCGCVGSYIRQRGYFVKHKHKNTKKRNRLRAVWNGMHWRCYNIHASNYNNYGGRGIIVCKEWKSSGDKNPHDPGFLNFVNWAIENRWEEGLQLDRIDNDGPYSPENCRWVKQNINLSNRQRKDRIKYLGKSYSFRDFEKQYKLKINTCYKLQNIDNKFISTELYYQIHGEKLKLTDSGYIDKNGYIIIVPKPSFYKIK